MATRIVRISLLGATLTCLVAGCQRGPKGPNFDPQKSAEDAMTQYDADSDGVLNQEEVAACPGLLSASERVDLDGDGSITKNEIAKRIEYYKTAPVRVTSGSMAVTYKGRPLANATVTLEPESFLGEEFQPCSGDTDDFGNTFLSRDDAEFPGIYLGFYRVRVSQIKDGKEKIPEKYNVNSMIGFEAAADLPLVSDVPTFHLK